MRKKVLGALAIGTLMAGLTAIFPTATALPLPAPHRDAPRLAAEDLCPSHPRPGFATCEAVALMRRDGSELRSTRSLDGLTPIDVQSAYHLTGLESGGATVAIVAPYGYSHLESDLALYRKTYRLPSCTTDNGCLTVIDEHGGSNYPPDNADWDQSQALGLDAVSATCPDCSLLVVQAKTSNLHDLEIAVDQAAEHTVSAVAANFAASVSRSSSAFDHPGIAITAPAGDGAYPAADPHVVAVGGTSIVRRAGTKRGWKETAWAGGGGCTPFGQPAWQRAADTTCFTRATNDVAAAADPNAGGLEVAYLGGFATYGGTSEAASIIAAVYALSGRTSGYPARFPYRSPQHLYDITKGSSGSCGVPLCEARKGWDGPTGMGTPNGVQGF